MGLLSESEKAARAERDDWWKQFRLTRAQEEALQTARVPPEPIREALMKADFDKEQFWVRVGLGGRHDGGVVCKHDGRALDLTDLTDLIRDGTPDRDGDLLVVVNLTLRPVGYGADGRALDLCVGECGKCGRTFWC